VGFRSSILAGINLVREAIQSPDYQPGVSGWSIKRDGSVEFNAGEFRGTLHVGDDQDYVEVGLDPNPKILLGTSNAAATGPGFLGYPTAGSPQLRLASPPSAGNSPGILALSPASAALLGDLQVILQSTAGPVQIAGDTGILMSGPAYTLDGVDQGRGAMNHTVVTAPSALAVGEQIVITTPNIQFDPGRAYKITFHYLGSGNTAGDGITFRLKRGGLGGTSLMDTLRTHDIAAAGAIVTGETSQIVQVSGGSSLTTAIVGTVLRSSGAGSVQGFGNPANPMWIEVVDAGDTISYPNAKAL
jgi:hypothetical protein